MKLHLFLILLFSQCAFAQYPFAAKIHSHNDYEQVKPFWEAYENGANSIEIDIVLLRDTLFVSHHADEIILERTIENLYLTPIQEIISVQDDSLQKLQLLIDVKSAAKPTLERLIEVLDRYEAILRNENISFVISGNRPQPKEYVEYPKHILFDYQNTQIIEDPEILKKIGLVSLPFYRFSDWNGEEEIPDMDLGNVEVRIEGAQHYMGKPFRFWGTPDTELAWKTLAVLGIDYINTDHPAECFNYIQKLKKEHHN